VRPHPAGKRRRAKGVKLAAFHDIIAQWLADPIKRHWTAERIFDELEERGYRGNSSAGWVRLNATRLGPSNPGADTPDAR